MTGWPVPDCKGDYYTNGTHNGEPVYHRNDSAYFLWYFSAGYWFITASIGDFSAGGWLSSATGPLGPYSPYTPYTGNPTVAAA